MEYKTGSLSIKVEMNNKKTEGYQGSQSSIIFKVSHKAPQSLQLSTFLHKR